MSAKSIAALYVCCILDVVRALTGCDGEGQAGIGFGTAVIPLAVVSRCGVTCKYAQMVKLMALLFLHSSSSWRRRGSASLTAMPGLSSVPGASMSPARNMCR